MAAKVATRPGNGHHPACVRSVAECIDRPVHAGALRGATCVGEAVGDGRVVRIGLWVAEDRVVRARFRATTCASLIAYAEVACAALEAGVAPVALDPPAVASLVHGVHPRHRDRAVLVTAAIRAALEEEAA